MTPNAVTNVNEPCCKMFNVVNLAHKLTPLVNVIPTEIKVQNFCHSFVNLDFHLGM